MQGMFSGTKMPVLSLVSRETGEVRSRTIPRQITDAALKAALLEEVQAEKTHLHTDGARQYQRIRGEFAGHETVDHSQREYVRGDVTTNHAETYFSQLKRSIDGTHHHVSVEHLPRYLAEFDFRFNTCKSTDTERLGKLVGQVAGRRLTYREPKQRGSDAI